MTRFPTAFFDSYSTSPIHRLRLKGKSYFSAAMTALCILTSVFSQVTHAQSENTPQVNGGSNDATAYLSQAKAGWSKLVEFSSQLQGTFFEKNVNRSTSQVVSEYQATIGQNGRMKMLHQKNIKPAYSEGAWAINTRYAFELKKHAPGLDWHTREIDTNLTDGVSIAFIKNSFGEGFTRAVCPLMIHTDWLPDMVKSENFRVVSVEDIDGLRYKFQYSINRTPSEIKQHVLSTEGWFVLSKDESWRPIEYSTKISYPPFGEYAIRSARIECLRQSKSMPIVTKIEGQEQPGPNQRIKLVLDFLKQYDLADRVPDETEFTLSTFGLLEPVTQTPPPNRNFLWITLGAVAAFVVGLLVRRKIKSMEAKAS